MTIVTLKTVTVKRIHGVSKKFDEWYQKTNKTEDTNKLTLLAFKIITILHNTLSWIAATSAKRAPQEYHERRTFYRRGGDQRTCKSGSAIGS
jgi:hypothetical protein